MTVGAGGQRLLSGSADHDTRSLRPTQILYGRYEANGQKVRVHAALRDLGTQKIVREYDAEATLPDGVFALADNLARELSGTARPIEGKKAGAVRTYGQALLATDPGERLKLLETAFREEPRFAPAAFALAQVRISQGEGPAALEVVKQAIGAQGDGPEKASLQVAAATLENDSRGLVAALERAVQFDPQNSDLALQLGERLVNRHRYADGVAHLKRALALEPGRTDVWNMLAYGQAYAGEEKSAIESVENYRKLAPEDPNIYDTAGEIYWFFGRFAQAEQNFLMAQQKSPQFLGGLEFAKAAQARLMAGDAKGADEMFGRYLETRKALKDPITDVREAHWWYLTGKRQMAFDRMSTLAAMPGEVGAIAGTFQALWLTLEGQTPKTPQVLQQAASKTRNPAILSQLGMVAILNQPGGGVAEITALIDRAMSPQTPPALKKMVLSYALLHARHPAEAAQLLTSLWQETSPNTDEVRMLLARAKMESGAKKEAAELLQRFPLPPAVGESPFSALWFPQFREWRKAAGVQ